MKINIIGFTPQSMNTKLSNKKKVINFSNLLPEILIDNNCKVTFKDFESIDYDYVFLFIGDLTSINSKYAIHCLKYLKIINHDKVIICIDDWKIKDILYSFSYCLKNNKFKNLYYYINKDINNYKSELQSIINGNFILLIPAFKNGLHNLLFFPCKKYYVIDPSIYCLDKYNLLIKSDFYNKKDNFVYAGLCDKFKWLKKFKNVIIIKDKKEQEVFSIYNENKFILSPPHYHKNSGWWRNRYIMSYCADSILIGDDEENKLLFGESYVFDLNRLGDLNYYNDMVYNQKKSFINNIMTKEECSNVIREVLKL